MIKKIKQAMVGLMATFMFALPLAVVPAVGAVDFSPGGSVCNGVNIKIDPDASGADCASDPTAVNKVNDTVKLALNLFSAIVGIISVVMIIVGGIRYITSGGDSGKVSTAQNTVLYAVIGLIVVALSQIIVKFVLNRFTQ